MANPLSITRDKKLSFPNIINDDQFEFSLITTNTPNSPDSPADHFFSNGKLLPHVFPIQEKSFSYSRSTSRTSSVSSKDFSVTSSRSNSTNSRKSNCSSARTSISTEASERRMMSVKERARPINVSPRVQHVSTKGWQFIASAPVLRTTKVDKSVDDRKGLKKSKGEIEKGVKSDWFGGKVLRLFVSACKECHAIETSSVETRIIEV